MSAFSSIDISRTGVGFAHLWMDTISHNIANSNTVRPTNEEPFRSQLVVAQELGADGRSGAGGGVTLREIREIEEPARLVHDPDHPYADEQGNVSMPIVDLTAQMTDMLVANRSYQANLRAVQSAREAYEAALRLGQGR